MEKKKSRSWSESEDLALVKAGAWAWFHRGSGSKGKPIREFDITRTEGASKPSRYKLEVMRNNTMEESETPITPIHADSSLLDSYEIQSICRRLDHLIEFSGIKFYDELLSNIDGDYQKHLVLDMGNKLKGFLLRRAMVVCGKNQDAEDDRRKPIKHNVPVIKMVNCKPRAPSLLLCSLATY